MLSAITEKTEAVSVSVALKDLRLVTSATVIERSVNLLSISTVMPFCIVIALRTLFSVPGSTLYEILKCVLSTFTNAP